MARGSFWPSPSQEALLVAALGGLDQAGEVWDSLRERLVVDELEPGSFDLMPLVYHRLSEAGRSDATLRRLKSIHRREWVKATLFAERTAATARALNEAAVRALFLGGSALSTLYYPSPGLRPSWFLEVLVEDLPTALAAFHSAGWGHLHGAGQEERRRVLLDRSRTVCVLRSSLAEDFVLREAPAGSNDPLWATARRVPVAGIEVLAPGPTEMLLVACVGGARLQASPSLLWILDAAFVIRSGEVNWRRLVEIGRSRGQALRLREALRYLGRLPGVAVPAEPLRALEREPVSLRERLGYELASGSLKVGGSLPELAAAHLATSSSRSLAGVVAGFPSYLASRWGVPPRQLPAAAGRRALRRAHVLRLRGDLPA